MGSRLSLVSVAGACVLVAGLSIPSAEAGTRRAGGFTIAKGVRLAKHGQRLTDVTTATACKDACWEMGACAAYSFEPAEKKCLISASPYDLGAAADDVEFGIFSQASSLPKLQAIGTTRATQMDAPGHDLRIVQNVPTEAVCVAACAENTSCQAYVYRASTQSCWLKSAVPQRQQGAGLVSGYVPWDDARTNYPRHLVFRHATATGQSLRNQLTGKKGQEAVVKCRDLCLGDTSCKAALADPVSGSCRMLKDVQPGSISQDVDGVDDRLVLKLDFKDGVRYVALDQSTRNARDQPGNDLRMQRIDDGALCRAVCALDRSCNAVTHNHDWTGDGYKDECYLKSKARALTSAPSNFITTSWLAGDDR